VRSFSSSRTGSWAWSALSAAGRSCGSSSSAARPTPKAASSARKAARPTPRPPSESVRRSEQAVAIVGGRLNRAVLRIEQLEADVAQKELQIADLARQNVRLRNQVAGLKAEVRMLKDRVDGA